MFPVCVMGSLGSLRKKKKRVDTTEREGKGVWLFEGKRRKVYESHG